MSPEEKKTTRARGGSKPSAAKADAPKATASTDEAPTTGAPTATAERPARTSRNGSFRKPEYGGLRKRYHDEIDRLRGLEISIVTTAKTDEEGRK
ncbi:MAG TPA: hypothetical protein VF295_00650, partial [Candidatus Limnocylindria bacterium]